jgi:hypothetical protein
MKKLTLQVDELAVESFSTGSNEGRMGTVEAREMVPTAPHPTCAPLTRLTDCPCTPAY